MLSSYLRSRFLRTRAPCPAPLVSPAPSGSAAAAVFTKYADADPEAETRPTRRAKCPRSPARDQWCACHSVRMAATPAEPNQEPRNQSSHRHLSKPFKHKVRMARVILARDSGRESRLHAHHYLAHRCVVDCQEKVVEPSYWRTRRT